MKGEMTDIGGELLRRQLAGESTAQYDCMNERMNGLITCCCF